ncbi:MAG TPA: zinc ABC transporter substrate-binding protein [Thermoplasmata archaeon]|nr:zinc ABC transporter substrate-binding protein [Thermoplasmata archaeon]
MVIPVVAAENVWGNLVAQLGGNRTSVLSIVTDPNADPHEYEGSVTDASAIDHAQLVIVNGVGYDDWALQLLEAVPPPGPLVLNAGTLNGVVVGGGLVSGNPHLWYNPAYVYVTVAAMYTDLVKIDPADASYFSQNFQTLNKSLDALYGGAAGIRAHFAGVAVAATEDLFVYLADFTGLNLVSPPDFMQAVGEGNDPPAQAVVTFQCQLESGGVRVLVYNQQTITPITTEMRALAAQHHILQVGATETIQPNGVAFQGWMGAEYHLLYVALNSTGPAG